MEPLSLISMPLFAKFGGSKIKDMMKKMGMESDEIMENSMISKSVEMLSVSWKKR